jgi:hypothetical protein
LFEINTYPDYRQVWYRGPTGAQGQAPPESIIEGLKMVIQQFRNGRSFRITDQKIIPGFDQSGGQSGMASQTHVEKGMVKIEYEKDGAQYEEEFYGSYTVNRVTSQGVVSLETIGWSLSDLFACSAPKGKVDDCKKIALTARNSSKTTLPFYNRLMQVVQLLQNQYYQQIYQAGQISKIISETNDQVSKIITDSYWDAQKTYERTNTQFSDVVRGVDRYNDGNGSQLQLPSGYSQAWMNDRGEYILSNTQGYDPNTNMDGSWKELQRDH